MSSSFDPKVIVALDFAEQNKALELVDRLEPNECRLKVGKEMFTRFGPEFVKNLQNKGFDVFLDLKFHDIPNTVAKAVKAAADLGVWMVNVHASGGMKMMEAARKELEAYGNDRPLLIAVTILTSMDEETLHSLGLNCSIDEQVLRLAKLTANSGLDGVVCSAREAPILRKELPESFKLITPGIRPVGASVGDQVRIVTPKQALLNGSNYLVIGRPITQAQNPLEELKKINESLK
ncbi:MAG: orotidine-5'-phosphate decarboxylase [Ruminobacter sp.]|nr:orotidine-5'-phosphate decarboxylase [Ruminobacter sp.]MDY5779358.1 orotidine-5'-phosphate decarboxylase [Succinivibrionaceae bacterium]